MESHQEETLWSTSFPSLSRNYDVKLRSALLMVVPEKVRKKALRTDDVNTVDILVDLITSVNPGIKSELESLKSFTTNPGVADSASEVEDILVNWQAARERMIQLGSSDISTMDATTALNMIIEEVIRQHEGFLHRYNNLVFQNSDIPTAAQAREIELLIQKELADCAGKDPTSSGRTWPTVTINCMNGRV